MRPGEEEKQALKSARSPVPLRNFEANVKYKPIFPSPGKGKAMPTRL